MKLHFKKTKIFATFLIKKFRVEKNNNEKNFIFPNNVCSLSVYVRMKIENLKFKIHVNSGEGLYKW